MRGDFSRIRFNPARQYTAVLEQQGRVALDADANEQAAIYDHLDRVETVDVIGPYGGPEKDEGFAITIQNNEIMIGPGRYYVAGLMCENPASLAYDSQRYLINPAKTSAQLLAELANAGGKLAIQVFLEVWQRLVTALDDPCLREPALGQADTTDRLQTVWRVVAVPRPVTDNLDCCKQMYVEAADYYGPSSGTLNAQPSGGTATCGCQPIASAGYLGLENQLYRVEIQRPGTETSATFKWSRENGSVVTSIQSMSGATIWVDSLGPDANLGFQPNQWVEITDDSYLFGPTPNRPGNLYQILKTDTTNRAITMTTTVLPVNTKLHARVRRWDQPLGSPASGIPVSTSFIPLENGIEVQFGAGNYRSGDYWTIPARSATGSIEWPPCGGNGAAFQSPHFMRVFAAPLACIHGFGGNFETNVNLPVGQPVEDCRRPFPPLTALATPVTTQAIHVTGISWAQWNDDTIAFDQLVAQGLTVTLDQAPTGPINGANFIVTFEAPTQALSNLPYAGTVQTTLVMRGITIVETLITVAGTTLIWLVPATALDNRVLYDFDQEVLSVGASAGVFTRVRVRLMGRAIFSTAAAANASKLAGGQIFLDGQAFGQAATRADGTARIALELPSGNGEKASDFEGWFYVAPSLQLVSLTVNYPALTVVTNVLTHKISVEAIPPGGTALQVVTPQATVAVNYPALADTVFALSLAGASGVGTVASIPASVTVLKGATQATFNISISSNPGRQSTLTFTISANPAASVPWSSGQTAEFTVTGTQEIVRHG